MVFLSSSGGISLKLQYTQISEGFLWELTRISIVFSWYFHGSPMGFLYGIPMAILMVVLWDFFGFPIGFP